jgi:hypothetical protein
MEGPRYNQKHYISYRINKINWLCVITTPNLLRLDFLTKANSFDANEVSKFLGIAKFDREETLSDKLSQPSSVFIKSRNRKTDRMYIRIKEDFNLESENFLKFLKDAYKAVPGRGSY